MTIIDYSTHSGDEGRIHRILSKLASILAPVVLGAVATLLLLYLMQALIAGGKSVVSADNGIHLVDFVRIPHATDVQTKARKPKRPPPPDEVPPETAKMDFNVAVDAGQGWSMKSVEVETDAKLPGAFSFASDGTYLPIVKVEPVYPRSAEARGLEGWVVLDFTVDSMGRVQDARVVDNCAHIRPPAAEPEECWDQPNKVFDNSALRAASRFKYKPKVVDGEAVAVHHIRHKFTFVLGN